jgi:hypothetical protein
MGKLIDFYKKAEADDKLRADLEAANKRFQGQENITRDAVVAELIKLAAQHGTSLESADFAAEPGELDEAELEAVTGASLCLLIEQVIFEQDAFEKGKKRRRQDV